VDLSLKGTPVGAKRWLYRFAYVPNSTYMNNAAAQSVTSRAWMCCAPALALLAPGIVAVLAHQLILFASLSPTAVTMIHQAGHPPARAYNSFVGHLVGLASACLFVFALGLSAAPSVFEVHSVSGARLAAALLSVALATLLEMLLRAQHPPAAATTLLVALGSFHPNWHDATLIISGVVLVIGAGMLLRGVHGKLIAR
jgi:hypothetical protein